MKNDHHSVKLISSFFKKEKSVEGIMPRMQLQHFDGDKCTTRFIPTGKKDQKRHQNNFINDENHVTKAFQMMG